MDGEIDSEIKCYSNAELCKLRMQKLKFIFIYYVNCEQSHRTEIQIMRAQTKMTNENIANNINKGYENRDNKQLTTAHINYTGVIIVISYSCSAYEINKLINFR